MNVAKAIESLEVSAETGGCDSEAVRTLREALTLTETRAQRREWRARILAQLKVMRVASTDVLVWRLPVPVLNDADEMVRVRAIAAEFAEVAKRGILILAEDTDLGPEAAMLAVYPKGKSAIRKPQLYLP